MSSIKLLPVDKQREIWQQAPRQDNQPVNQYVDDVFRKLLDSVVNIEHINHGDLQVIACSVTDALAKLVPRENLHVLVSHVLRHSITEHTTDAQTNADAVLDFEQLILCCGMLRLTWILMRFKRCPAALQRR